ncbi:MAG: hypothetical protein MPJ50_02510 [Pirellulales bacterium]|nr:hypothetical protein [Pirellulales bacterium]
MSQHPHSLRARLAFIRRLIEFFRESDFGSILDLIKQIDQKQIMELIGAVRQLMVADAWVGADGRVAAAMRIAKIVAQFSESEFDDQLIATLEGILQNVGVLNAIAVQCEVAAKGQPVAMTAGDQEIYEAAGFDLGTIIAIINLILELFRKDE